jgi:translation initiation factor 1
VAGKPAQPKKRGRVVLRRETARRGGKCVSVIDDFPTHFRLSEIEEIARALRAACGCGGTVKDRKIEIQGEQIAKMRELLEADGFQVAGVR